MQSVWLSMFWSKCPKVIFENTNSGKVLRVQPMSLYIFLGEWSEVTYDSTQRRNYYIMLLFKKSLYHLCHIETKSESTKSFYLLGCVKKCYLLSFCHFYSTHVLSNSTFVSNQMTAVCETWMMWLRKVLGADMLKLMLI